MDDEIEMEAVTAPAPAMDLKGLSEQLQALSEMITKIQAALPVDAGEERAEEIDEGQAEADEQPEEDGSKAASKAAAAAMLAKQLG